MAKALKLRGPDAFSLPVVGEASYQANLIAIVGKKTKAAKPSFADAELRLEDTNPYDNMAVRIDIQGKTVGYLSREHARQYRQRLSEAGLSGEVAICRAKIIGGSSPEESKPLYGVWLDIPVSVGPLSS